MSSANLDGVLGALEGVLGPKATIERTGNGFTIEATVVGVDARELNRRLLSAMRQVDKSSRMRAEWASDGGTDVFADYVFVKARG